MPPIDLYSWPSPVDDRKIGTLILTEESLFFSLHADPAKVEALGDSATASRIEAALPRRAYSVSIVEILALSMVVERPRFRIIAAHHKKTVAFGDGREGVAAEVFGSLVHRLGFETREVAAKKWETFGNPILFTLLILLGGLYLGFLAGQDHHGQAVERSWIVQLPYDVAHWAGPVVIWGGAAVGIFASVVWLGYRLNHPMRALLASRGGENQASARSTEDPGDDVLRRAMAELLGVDAKLLRPETNFHDDLKIPPGVLLDVLGLLEENFDLEVSSIEIKTFGEVLVLLRR